MNANATLLSTTCAVSICLISLTSSLIYKRELSVTSELMAIVSFLPAFVCALIAVWDMPLHLNSELIAALMFKNILYCLSFYFRYESLRIFGPFVGALMLGTQPIVIIVLGSVLLGEHLSGIQVFSMAVASVGLLLLASKDPADCSEQKITVTDFGKYYVFPMLASALAIVWDRYFLRGALSGNEFFVIDRLFVVPAFIFSVGLLRGSGFLKALWPEGSSVLIIRNWKSLALIGILFTVSVYTYNLALEVEKVALVSLIRNISYPMAAFAGAFIFRQEISVKRWVSFSLVLLSVALGAT